MSLQTKVIDKISKNHFNALLRLLNEKLPINNGRPQSLSSISTQLLFAKQPNNELDTDGYYKYLSPSSILNNPTLKFKRRMWAQGKLEMFKDIVAENEYLCDTKLKYIKRIKQAYHVCLEKQIMDQSSVIFCKEVRNLVYTNSIPEVNVKQEMVSGINGVIFEFTRENVLEYAKLSGNPHLIHRNLEYVKTEGYNDLVVPGPLLVQLAAQFAKNHTQKEIKVMKYKNKNILLANAPAYLCLGESSNSVVIRDHTTVYLEADIEPLK